MIRNKNFILAKIYYGVVIGVLVALLFVRFNYVSEAVWSLSQFFAYGFDSPFWVEHDISLMYKVNLIVALTVAGLSLMLILIKDARIFRVLSVGVFAIAAMFFAFMLGAQLNADGFRGLLLNYNVVAFILSMFAYFFGSSVTIVKAEDLEKEEVASENV